MRRQAPRQPTDVPSLKFAIVDEPQSRETSSSFSGLADTRVIEPLTEAGKSAVIPPRANRRIDRTLDRHLYKARHMIENILAKLKQFRAIATRYDKTARYFLARSTSPPAPSCSIDDRP
jgi:hypothetical protein